MGDQRRGGIGWTDFSVNPIRAVAAGSGRVGHYCEKVSAGCKNCYSSRLQPRFGLPQFQEQRTDCIKPFLDDAVLDGVVRRRKPAKFFWCDMTDMFGDWVPDEWITACFGVMAATPQHTHQVLTKRARRTYDWFRRMGTSNLDALRDSAFNAIGKFGELRRGTTWPLPNVWLGVSAEDQKNADERIPWLMETPAAIRFVSYEPMLGPLRLWKLASGWYHENTIGYEVYPLSGMMAMPDCDWGSGKIDWVIAGAESGPGARPMDDSWIRAVRDECVQHGTKLFFKQRVWPGGRKILAPELDGRTWLEFPSSTNEERSK